jgi:hypothetical protein
MEVGRARNKLRIVNYAAKRSPVASSHYWYREMRIPEHVHGNDILVKGFKGATRRLALLNR